MTPTITEQMTAIRQSITDLERERKNLPDKSVRIAYDLQERIEALDEALTTLQKWRNLRAAMVVLLEGEFLS